MFKFVLFLCMVAYTNAYNVDERFEHLETLIQQQNLVIDHQQKRIENLNSVIDHQQKRIENLESLLKEGNTRMFPSYNATIEELEIRVERLEEDMHGAQGDINDLQYSVQETIETVIDHSDNLDQLEQDISSIETNTEGLDNRTTDIEENILVLESDIQGLDVRTADIEQILSESKDSAFFATLSANAVFEEPNQIIIFDNDKINEGGHYNVTSGTYTAPVSGIYQFFPYMRANPQANLHIYVDGTSFANPVENDTVDNTQGEGTSVMIRLEAGQVVDVRTGNTAYTVYGNSPGQYSWFGGHLLFPDTE